MNETYLGTSLDTPRASLDVFPVAWGSAEVEREMGPLILTPDFFNGPSSTEGLLLAGQWQQFNRQRYARNCQIITDFIEIATRGSKGQLRDELLAEFFPVPLTTYDFQLKPFITADDITDTLPNLLRVKPIVPNGNYLLTGSSHRSLESLTDKCEDSGCVMEETALIVLDHHTDTTSFPGEVLRRLGVPVRKNNVLDFAQARGFGKIVVIGPNAQLYGLLKQFQDFWFSEQLILPQSLMKKNPHRYPEGYNVSVDIMDVLTIVEQLRSSGIRRVLFSGDIDVIHEPKEVGQITACHYSAINNALFFGTNDVLGVMQEVIPELTQEKIKLAVEIISGVSGHNKRLISADLARAIETVFHAGNVSAIIDNLTVRPLRQAVSVNGVKDGQDSGYYSRRYPFGLTVQEVVNIIGLMKMKFNELGIEVGFVDRQGRRIVGELTELLGKDLRGNTAKAAREIALALTT